MSEGDRLRRTAALHYEVRGDVDPRAIEQLARCADEKAIMPDTVVGAALCADGHVGYSQPIGGVVAYANHISPSGVGYDIGCGNKAVKTNVVAENLRYDPKTLPKVMDEIVARISFGMGRPNNEPVDHPVLDGIASADFKPQRDLVELAAKQLGTVGSGNHYVDLFYDEDGWLWVGVHFGSRGFGHRTASGFLALAQGQPFDGRARDGEMDSPPVLFRDDSDLGQSYIAAMQLAGEYAYAGRDVVVEKVLGILGAEAVESVHNHHNFAWRETHHGREAWVVRKGATPAWPGQQGFVGATMGESSVILEGVEAPAMADLLYSTVHGAGRTMSRTEAAGKSRWRLQCSNRDCDWTQPPRTPRPADGKCPGCGNDRLRKRPVKEGRGKIDWDVARADVAERGVVLRGAAADEAPGAYKRLDAVLDAHSDTIRIVHTLYPIGVAMAGPDIYDPFKD